MKKLYSAVIIASLFATMPAHAVEAKPRHDTEEQKRDANLKVIKINSTCRIAIGKLAYAMPYANKHGISQADAVAKMQTIASDKNKPLVRYMAIEAYYDLGDTSKADTQRYCAKMLAKRTQEELDESFSLLDGGDALTLFVNY